MNKYNTFSKECNTTYASLLTKLCKNSITILSSRCDKLLKLYSIKDVK